MALQWDCTVWGLFHSQSHEAVSFEECSTFAFNCTRTGHAIHSGLQVPLPYLEMALRTMVDTRGEGRDGVPLRR